MEFSWDEAKRLWTIKDRAIDFIEARDIFDGRPVVHQPTPRGEEDRWKSTAMSRDLLFTVIWVDRGDKRHIISMRRAHGHEIRHYRQLHRH